MDELTATESQEYQFDLDGDEPSLDFVNAWRTDASEEDDELDRALSLVSFARQSELLTDAEAQSLAQRLAADASACEVLVRRALSLRSNLRSIFSACAAEEAIPPGSLERLNREVAAACTTARLEVGDPGLNLSWGRIDDSPASLLGPIVRSAVDVLTGEDAERLRVCDSPTCRWLFVDHSRNRSRRWCSMETCGNRAKARRHYRRQTRSESD